MIQQTSPQGGPIEARSGVALAEPEKSFAEKAQTAFDNFSETTLPLRLIAPNLGDFLPLKDPAGGNFNVIPAQAQNGKINYIEIVSGGHGEEGALIYYTIAEDPNDTKFINEQTGVNLKGEEALKAGIEKLEELLAPIKAAQATRQPSQTSPAKETAPDEWARYRPTHVPLNPTRSGQ